MQPPCRIAHRVGVLAQNLFKSYLIGNYNSDGNFCERELNKYNKQKTQCDAAGRQTKGTAHRENMDII